MIKQPEIKEVQVSDFKRMPERAWTYCKDCESEVFRDANGKTFYHKRGCKKDKMEYYTHPSNALRG